MFTINNIVNMDSNKPVPSWCTFIFFMRRISIKSDKNISFFPNKKKDAQKTAIAGVFFLFCDVIQSLINIFVSYAFDVFFVQ